jgi:hypothetical protein
MASRVEARAENGFLRSWPPVNRSSNDAEGGMTVKRQQSFLFSVVSVAQLDRALGCGPSGRGFESHHSPHAPVAQLDRASDFESAGRPFESGRAHH